jgi:hypothetical protein
MRQGAAIMVLLLFAILQQQRAIMGVQQVFQSSPGFLPKRLHGFAMLSKFRGVDANEPYPAAVLEFYGIAVIDVDDMHAFAGVIGRTGSCQRLSTRDAGQNED